MNFVWLFLAVALIGGCATHPTFPGSPFGDVTPPPFLSEYATDTLSQTELKQYTDDMNWYIGYLFSYTKNLNRYAMTVGWQPPDSTPLCQLMETPQLEPFPQFVRRREGNPDDFEWELTDFIRELRNRHLRDTDTLNRAVVYQRGFCLY